jgi:hypothetical protein
MALTATQQQQVIKFLGWTGKTLIPESTHYNSYIFDRLQNLNPDIEAQSIEILGWLLAIDAKLFAALDRMSAREVGDIKINERESDLLRKERWRRIRELSDLLDIVVVKQSGGSINVVS